MPDQYELPRGLRVDRERLQIFVDRGWISPPLLEGRPVLREVDVARIALIADLGDAMGVNDEGIDVVLDLLDQLYGMRLAIGNLIDALEIQPRGIRINVVNDARRLHRLTRRDSRPVG